jgi:hypothetical protein
LRAIAKDTQKKIKLVFIVNMVLLRIITSLKKKKIKIKISDPANFTVLQHLNAPKV